MSRKSPAAPSRPSRPPRTPRRHRQAIKARPAAASQDRPRAPLLLVREGPSPAVGTCVIVHKDNHLVLVDKGPGLLTVKTDTGNPPTVMGELHERLRGAHDALFAVHRLDRDTSGVLVVARNRHALGLLVGQLRDRAFDRIYLALVRGNPPKCGTITGHLGTVGKDLRMRQVAADEGQLAITHFRVVEQAAGMALVALKLETGRRNQIRAQLAQLGFPIVGEQQYAPINAQGGMPRQALHSHRLTLAHPIHGRMLQTCSPLPVDMAKAWARAGGKHGGVLAVGFEIPGAGALTFEQSLASAAS